MALVNLSLMGKNAEKKRLSVASALISKEQILLASGKDKVMKDDVYPLFMLDAESILESVWVHTVKGQDVGVRVGFVGVYSKDPLIHEVYTKPVGVDSATTTDLVDDASPEASDTDKPSTTPNDKAIEAFGVDLSIASEDAGKTATGDIGIHLSNQAIVGVKFGAHAASSSAPNGVALNGGVYRVSIRYLEPTVSTGEYTSYAVTQDNLGNDL